MRRLHVPFPSYGNGGQITLGELAIVNFGWKVNLTSKQQDFIKPHNKLAYVVDMDIYPSLMDALYLLRGMSELINIFSTIPFNIDDRWFTLLGILGAIPQAGWLKIAKYYTVWPMAKFLGNDLPNKPPYWPADGPSFLISGPVKRFLKNRLLGNTVINCSFWASWLLEIKKVCLAAPLEAQYQAMESHSDTLSQYPPELDWGELDDLGHFCKILLRKLKPRYSTPRKRETYEGSLSASLLQQRKSGGQRMELMDLWDESPDQLIRMVELSPGVVKEVRGRFITRDPRNVWQNEVYGGVYPKIPFSLSVSKNPDYELSYVKVAVVLDPLKVRLVTKGDSYLYWRAKAYQKDMWSYLNKTFPQFVIGRTLTASDLYFVREKMNHLIPNHLSKNWFWVSGDYAAATDWLNLIFTKFIFEEILQKLGVDPITSDELRAIIYEVNIRYPKPMEHLNIVQKNGQLMGSPLSFPILCIINLWTYWQTAKEYFGRVIPIKDLPVLVNGDDILFQADHTFYEMWQRNIRSAGFKLSLGKNYTSTRYLTMNSQVFRVYDGEFYEVPRVRLGLLMNSHDRKRPIWDCYNLMMESVSGFSESMKSICHYRFLHYHSKQVLDYTHNGNYSMTLPREVGGLGFNYYSFIPTYYTNFQRQWATYLFEMARTSPEEYRKAVFSSNLKDNNPSDKDLVYVYPQDMEVGIPVGPLMEGWSWVEPQTSRRPSFARPNLGDEPDLIVRRPDPSLLKAFRNGPRVKPEDLSNLIALRGVRWIRRSLVHGVST
jgi:hypothetical protein